MAEGGPLAGGNSAAKTPMGTDDEIYSVLTESIRAELGAGELAVHSCEFPSVRGRECRLLGFRRPSSIAQAKTDPCSRLLIHSSCTDTTQVVAGTRYQIKIRAGNGTFWHFSVIKPLPHTGDPPFIQPGALRMHS